MFCTTIIPTVNRATLTQAVLSVLAQDFHRDDFEVIVVNDSGSALPEMDWIKSDRVRVINTYRHERCVARNTAAAIARGKYLHFLDDDDWMLPGAFDTFWKLASQESTTAWLYGGYNLVNEQGDLLEECRPDERGNCFVRFVAGEWLPLQASLIASTAFFAVGGFASWQSLIGGDEDVDLARLISLREPIAGTNVPVTTIRFKTSATTTDYSNLSEQSRLSREKALNSPGAFSRLNHSARERKPDPAYWKGRILWFYLTSIYWNIQHKRPFTAASRVVSSLASLILSLPYLFSTRFWRGATTPHMPKGWLLSG